MYSIKLEKFEGPMELLLELIEKDQLEITELSLSKVAEEYLEHIKNNDKINLQNLAEFLSVASKLILIKSRALLPVLKFSDEEEEEIEDLAHKLEEYKKFKEASQKIKKMSEAGQIAYSREGFGGVATIFYPPENFNIFDFKKYFLGVLSEIPDVRELGEEIVREVVSLEERINELENSIRQKVETSFSSFVSESNDKIDVIISFLAMLEMIKQRVVEVKQEDLFSEIKLSLKTS